MGQEIEDEIGTIGTKLRARAPECIPMPSRRIYPAENELLISSRQEFRREFYNFNSIGLALAWLPFRFRRVFLPLENAGGNIRRREKMECTLARAEREMVRIW